MFTGKYDTSHLSFLCFTSHEHDTRGHQLKLHHNIRELNLRKHFFMNRIDTMWNDPPENVLQVKTVNDFETQLDLFWMEQPFNLA